jgi:predicted glycosyltransferase
MQVVDEEAVSSRALEDGLRLLLASESDRSAEIDCNGAENTARHLHRLVQERD